MSYHLNLLRQIAKVAFYVVVGTVCAAVIAYALVDMYVALSTVIWVHQ